MEKLILTAALTGAITVPTQTPHLPYTIEGIADDGIACAKAGATVIHVHGRNPETGHPTSDPEVIRQIVVCHFVDKVVFLLDHPCVYPYQYWHPFGVFFLKC
jgi:uncharacterized protein (DUF849 family)